jgi:hypothetical protein
MVGALHPLLPFLVANLILLSVTKGNRIVTTVQNARESVSATIQNLDRNGLHPRPSLPQYSIRLLIVPSASLYPA